LCPVFGLNPELVSGLFSHWFCHNFCHNSRLDLQDVVMENSNILLIGLSGSGKNFLGSLVGRVPECPDGFAAVAS
jgi:ATP-dependent protease Clp ATPase subunit